jgi:hypothetical protein
VYFAPFLWNASSAPAWLDAHPVWVKVASYCLSLTAVHDAATSDTRSWFAVALHVNTGTACGNGTPEGNEPPGVKIPIAPKDASVVTTAQSTLPAAAEDAEDRDDDDAADCGAGPEAGEEAGAAADDDDDPALGESDGVALPEDVQPANSAAAPPSASATRSII